MKVLPLHLDPSMPYKELTVQDFINAFKKHMNFSFDIYGSPTLEVTIYTSHTKGSGAYRIRIAKDYQSTYYKDMTNPNNKFMSIKNIDLSKINCIKELSTIVDYNANFTYDHGTPVELEDVYISTITLSFTLYGIRRKKDCILAKIKANEKYLND